MCKTNGQTPCVITFVVKEKINLKRMEKYVNRTWMPSCFQLKFDFKHIGEKKIFKEGLEYSRAVS
jgi:hypothetical protein